jgi:hypothetical protein
MCIHVHSSVLALFSLLETILFASGKFVAQSLVLDIKESIGA